jgi:hypothetical protein
VDTAAIDHWQAVTAKNSGLHEWSYIWRLLAATFSRVSLVIRDEITFMRRTVLAEPGLLVVDNLLPPHALDEIRFEMSKGDYRSVHLPAWRKVWRLWDGEPLRGAAVVYDPQSLYTREARRYPTFTSVDLLIDEIRRAAADHPDTVGVEGRDWKAVYLAPWLYPVGSALSRHVDGARYSGAFTWFAHPRWGVHWGGELVVEPPDDGQTIAPELEPWMLDDGTDCGSGIGTMVSPLPNRLALIGPNRPHRIARVDPNAGARVRSSIAGFFLQQFE